jgi:hypothetical protein
MITTKKRILLIEKFKVFKITLKLGGIDVDVDFNLYSTEEEIKENIKCEKKSF